MHCFVVVVVVIVVFVVVVVAAEAVVVVPVLFRDRLRKMFCCTSAFDVQLFCVFERIKTISLTAVCIRPIIEDRFHQY